MNFKIVILAASALLMGACGDTEEDVASDPSYGMGASIKLNERNALTVEWLQLEDDDNDLTTVNVGYLFRY